MEATKEFIDYILEPIKALVTEAASNVKEIYNCNDDLVTLIKEDGSPVTEADKKSNDIILETLKALTPEIQIISEETYSKNNIHKYEDLFWLIDPLDGTKEFINKTGEFTINIALISKNKPVFGVVSAPISGQIWTGSIFDKKLASKKLVSKKLRIVSSRNHITKNDKKLFGYLDERNIAFELVEKGSSIKICNLADNVADIYPRFGPTSEWDIAAAHAVLLSSGGSILKLSNFKTLDYGKEKTILNPPFIAFRNNDMLNKYGGILSDFYKNLL